MFVMWNIIMNDNIAVEKTQSPSKTIPFKCCFPNESPFSTLVCQTESGVEQASEAKSEPKPAPVENGVSHTLSVTPKPASQLNTQPQSIGTTTKFI